jgi:hypothetical protein
MKKLSLVLLLFMSSTATIEAQDDYGFRFVRVKYQDIYQEDRESFENSDRWFRRRRSRRGMWATDYPTADLNLHEAIMRTTKIHVRDKPIVLSFADKEIYEYPILYLTEPGYWVTNDEEVQSMQKYFARGGFMIIDDFHDYGTKGRQWYNFYYNIKQVFPDREPVLLANDHPIWTIYFDINPDEAPSTKPEFSSDDCQYYAIYDDEGNMMCVICYNQDIGDGWEWPGSLAMASTVSYQMAINFIIYALTH